METKFTLRKFFKQWSRVDLNSLIKPVALFPLIG